MFVNFIIFFEFDIDKRMFALYNYKQGNKCSYHMFGMWDNLRRYHMNYKYYNGVKRNNLILSELLTLIKQKRIIVIIGIFIVSIMILSLSIISTKVTAEKFVTREKSVTSIKIEKGYSLWSIASQYITEEYDDMNTYIEEIMNSNGLTSEVIHEGNYIIVPYYTVIDKSGTGNKKTY